MHILGHSKVVCAYTYMIFPVSNVLVYGASTLMVLWLGVCGMTVFWPDFIKFASLSPVVAAQRLGP